MGLPPGLVNTNSLRAGVLRTHPLLVPWSAHTFPVRDHIGLLRPLSLPSLPTKEQFDPNQVFPLPPPSPSSGTEVLLFSDGSKAGSKVGAAFVHLHPSGSIIKSHLLPLPWYMSVFDAELYAASCALQYAATLNSHSKVVSLSIDNQATISASSRLGYSYLAHLLHDIRNATIALSHSGCITQVGWTPRHSSITGNDLADAAAKLVAEGTPSVDFPWSYSHLCSQVRSQLLQEWQTWHKPRDDFPFPPSTKLSAIFALPRHAATRLFQMKLSASYLLGHPNRHRPEPGL